MEKSEELKQAAVRFVKNNKQVILDKFAGSEFSSVEKAISVFMAGSPGAGKTEFSKELVTTFEKQGSSERIVRIDPDELRVLFDGYTGSNSDVFQYPASLAVEKIHDYVLSANKHFILDGTFSNYEKAKGNIKRSLDKGRDVDVYYIYQDPILAWEITQKREALEGRSVPKEVFVNALFGSHDTVNLLKKEFGKDISLNVFIRDARQDMYKIRLDVDDIDRVIKIDYNKNSLLQKI